MRNRWIIAIVGAAALAGLPDGAIGSDGEKDEKTLEISGDLRGRWEGFWFREDATESKIEDRQRLRYRFRVNADAKINDRSRIGVRIGTGDTDTRSGNQTLGSPVDFGPSELDLRRAYLEIGPFANAAVPGAENSKWVFQFGRIANPFIWKSSPDKMLWDGDINPGGLATKFKMDASENTSIFANAGAFVIDENKGGKDPYLAAIQAGVSNEASEKVSLGGRGTYYHFDRLDEAFIDRGVDGSGGVTSGGGNVPDGLTGNPSGGKLQVVEAQAFVKLKGSPNWPATAFGGFSNNTSAKASEKLEGVGKENQAFNLGLEVGDKKKAVRLGAAFVHIEANAFPSQFIDSDILDGRTNRKGFLVYGSRQFLKNVDFNVTLLSSEPIATSEEFAGSVKGSERTRAQVDVVLKF